MFLCLSHSMQGFGCFFRNPHTGFPFKVFIVFAWNGDPLSQTLAKSRDVTSQDVVLEILFYFEISYVFFSMRCFLPGFLCLPCCALLALAREYLTLLDSLKHTLYKLRADSLENISGDQKGSSMVEWLVGWLIVPLGFGFTCSGWLGWLVSQWLAMGTRFCFCCN